MDSRKNTPGLSPLVQLLTAIVLGDPKRKGDEEDTHRRLMSVIFSLDTLTKAVRAGWKSPLGTLIAATIHAITGSPLASSIAAAATGGPRKPPQSHVYGTATDLLEVSTVVLKPKRDYAIFIDNTQGRNRKTCAIAREGASARTVGAYGGSRAFWVSRRLQHWRCMD